MSSSIIAQYLKKEPDRFTRKDIIRFIEENDVRRLNFRYVGGDGRLKTLNFVLTGRRHLERILSAGERVDGSSLFPHIAANVSDLYVIPRFRTAFVNPFTNIPTVDILCSYYTHEGKPFSGSPENILRKAHDTLKQKTGISLHAMGELEYYVIAEKSRPGTDLYPLEPQKGYKESQPFSKMEEIRCEAMDALAKIGVPVKYGHSEVAAIYDEDHQYIEQNEIEFLPAPLEDAADHLVIARWVLRMVGHRHGVTVSFAPKIALGHAGNGMHIHMQFIRRRKNITFVHGDVSDIGRRAIAGILMLAPSLTAFGNTVPSSYLRLSGHQEVPMGVFWGERNRLAMIRIPLCWSTNRDMIRDANPGERSRGIITPDNATIEFRCPDGSADVYLTMAGLAVAVRHGLEMENALEIAKRLYASKGRVVTLEKWEGEIRRRVPSSCDESAENLLRDRETYQEYGVFPPEVIDGVVAKLRSYNDRGLISRSSPDELKKVMKMSIHCA